VNVDVVLEVKGEEVLEGKWLQDAKRAWIERASRIVFDTAHENLSGRLVRVQSGKLLGSLQAEFGLVGDEPVASIGTKTGGKTSHGFLGRFLETGVAAHEMRREGGFLLRRGGQWFRTRVIQHPGVSPRRWLQTALEESLPAVREGLAAEIRAGLAQVSASSSKPEVIRG